jgi:hypothetical protein
MNRTLTRIAFVVTTLIALGATARRAAAQVYPERIPSAFRAQQRDRDRERANREQQQRSEQVDRTTRTLRIGANGELDLNNISGDIVLTRGSGQEATIEIVKTARGQTPEDAKELLGLVQVDVVERGNRAEVRTRYPSGDEMRGRNRRNFSVSVNFNVTAPVGARVTARSISGNVSARDLRGEIALESTSGNVIITNGGRVASAKTISGNVEVSGTEIDGGLEASSVSGTVTVRKTKARRMTLSTVSGNLALEDVDCGRVELQAVSGDVQLAGPLSPAAATDFSPHSGNVRIIVNGDTGFELDANSFSGSIRSDLPLTGSVGGDDRGPGSAPSAASTGTAVRSSTSPPSLATSSSRSGRSASTYFQPIVLPLAQLVFHVSGPHSRVAWRNCRVRGPLRLTSLRRVARAAAPGRRLP